MLNNEEFIIQKDHIYSKIFQINKIFLDFPLFTW